MSYTGDVELPPPVAILLDEDVTDIRAPEDVSRVLSGGLLEELQRQARWTRDKFRYSLQPASGFATAPAGALNPFSEIAKCTQHYDCAIQHVDAFLRTAAIYSDAVF